MKHTLKAISYLLPYSLKCQCMGEVDNSTDKPIEFTAIGIDDEKVILEYPEGTRIKTHYTEVFPILMPLSQLTANINHNSQEICPMKELLKICLGYWDDGKFYKGDFDSPRVVINKGDTYNEDAHLIYYKNSLGVESWLSFKDTCFTHVLVTNRNKIGGIHGLVVENQFMMFEYLFELNFDLFGLIEDKKAIKKQNNCLK